MRQADRMHVSELPQRVAHRRRAASPIRMGVPEVRREPCARNAVLLALRAADEGYLRRDNDMTDAEHAELSARVAKAIGWPITVIGVPSNPNIVSVYVDDGVSTWHRRFDYRAPSVALGLLKWLGEKHNIAVELWKVFGEPAGWRLTTPTSYVACEDTIELAIARAVLAVAERKS